LTAYSAEIYSCYLLFAVKEVSSFLIFNFISSPKHEVVRRCSSCVNIWCLHSRDHICDTIFIKLGQNVCLTKSRPSSNMGHVVSKSRSPGQTRFWWNLVRMFVLTISRPSSKICHVWSKTRSSGQVIFESLFFHSKIYMYINNGCSKTETFYNKFKVYTVNNWYTM